MKSAKNKTKKIKKKLTSMLSDEEIETMYYITFAVAFIMIVQIIYELRGKAQPYNQK